MSDAGVVTTGGTLAAGPYAVSGTDVTDLLDDWSVGVHAHRDCGHHHPVVAPTTGTVTTPASAVFGSQLVTAGNGTVTYAETTTCRTPPTSSSPPPAWFRQAAATSRHLNGERHGL